MFNSNNRTNKGKVAVQTAVTATVLYGLYKMDNYTGVPRKTLEGAGWEVRVSGGLPSLWPVSAKLEAKSLQNNPGGLSTADVDNNKTHVSMKK